MAMVFKQANQVPGVATSQPIAFSSNNTLGSYLLCWVQSVANGTIAVPTDSAGNTWVRIGTQVTLLTESWSLFQVLSSKGGANTVTAVTTVGGMNIGIAEYTGQAAPTPLDTSTALALTSATTSFTSANLTTAQASEELIFLGWTSVGPVITPGAGYTVEMANGAAGAYVLDSATVAASQGTYNCSFTSNTSTTLGGYLLAVKTAASATVYSEPDCRAVTTITPNSSRNVQATLIYDVQKAESRVAPYIPVDSRAATPVDSRAAGQAPQNSRTPGTFGPGQ